MPTIGDRIRLRREQNLMGWEEAEEDKKAAPAMSEGVKKLIDVISQLTLVNQRMLLATATR